MSEMIERVAAIISAGVCRDDPSQEIARAAIAAMREPTEAMLEAGGDPYLDVPVSAIWRAMIDAALK